MSPRRSAFIGAIVVILAIIGLFQFLRQVVSNAVGPVLAADIGRLIVFVGVELVILYFVYTAVLLLISSNRLVYALVKYYRRTMGAMSDRRLTGAARPPGAAPVDLDPPRLAWSRRFLRGCGGALLLVALVGQYLFTRFWIV
jgi:hypothetical protein